MAVGALTNKKQNKVTKGSKHKYKTFTLPTTLGQDPRDGVLDIELVTESSKLLLELLNLLLLSLPGLEQSNLTDRGLWSTW